MRAFRRIVFAAAFLGAMIASNAYAQMNLVANGGFDAGLVPLGWTVSGTSLGMDDYDGANRASDGDGWYAKMGTGAAAPDGIFYQQVMVTAGELHAFSLDYRRQGYTDENLTIDVFDGAIDGTNLTSNPLASGGLFSSSLVVNESRGYQEEAGTFTPTQSTVTLRLSDIGAAASENAGMWVDNVKLIETFVPASDSATTFDAIADAEIDQHVNYNAAALGFETSMRVEIRSADYQNPVESPPSWGLMKWNLSSIDPSAVIDNASVRIIQGDGAVDAVDVYGVQVGDWDEATVSWATWAGTETLQLLGTMTDVSYHDNGGVTTFSDPALTAWVQDWIDGDQDNYGLLLKWSGDVGEGDTFVTRENATLDAPQLIINGNIDPYVPGDANRDRKVDEDDAAILAENWLTSGYTVYWSKGDFNNDHLVDDVDATLMAANWYSGVASASVPEPGVFVLLGAGLMVFLLRRKR